MARIAVINWITLDGVMQGPGRPDEDTRDGFSHGGWAAAYADPTVGAKMGELMSGHHAWLFGRTTYEELLESWDRQGGPYREALHNQTKYVASSRADTTLAWPNSILLDGDVPAAVARLKAELDETLVVMGSGVLINSLVRADLIDQYLLVVAPLVLGTGRRLFADGTRTSLRLRECTPTETGAVVLSYECAR